MCIARYAHRLPADYDLGLIRTRVETRGQQWNATPGLYFKAFLLRERDRFGAAANSYTSLYLWRDADPFRDFLAARADAQTNSFMTVTSSFGRPQIDTWLPLDARRGRQSAGSILRLCRGTGHCRRCGSADDVRP